MNTSTTPKINLRVTSSSGGKKDGYESGQWIREITVEILENGQKIGTATVIDINADGALEDGFSLHDLMDHSGNLLHCGYAVYDFSCDFGLRSVIHRLFPAIFDIEHKFSFNLLLLERLEIDPPFRGRGIGLIVLSKLIKRWGKAAALVVMKPFPLQYVELE